MPLTITYQYETGFRTLHQAHTDIILFTTQLEAINKTIGGSKNEKYMKPINEYASLFLIQEIVTSYLLSDLGINNIIIEKYQAQTIQE